MTKFPFSALYVWLDQPARTNPPSHSQTYDLQSGTSHRSPRGLWGTTFGGPNRDESMDTCAFSPTGDVLAVAGRRGHIHLVAWRSGAAQVVAELMANTGIRSLVIQRGTGTERAAQPHGGRPCLRLERRPTKDCQAVAGPVWVRKSHHGRRSAEWLPRHRTDGDPTSASSTCTARTAQRRQKLPNLYRWQSDDEHFVPGLQSRLAVARHGEQLQMRLVRLPFFLPGTLTSGTDRSTSRLSPPLEIGRKQS
ncbi:hypothetical protein J3R83DRAFT_7085 [Lanmaoa asiatica]|nr:hypothetical protein J3R83DRAFT_7085 [Lanmaoa asiatica]